ncbi:CopG family transcriptional regulator [Ramlibacter sp.]|uniref:CopG family transcriptional regulator n=1 Tax=Ramlibacter sp. TaxID=1917967 RepID=UPI003D0FBF4B
MSITNSRISDDLKQRIARAAARAGVSAHELMVEAIAHETERVERHADFHEEADARMERFLASGKSIPWHEARKYVLDRDAATGRKPIR